MPAGRDLSRLKASSSAAVAAGADHQAGLRRPVRRELVGAQQIRGLAGRFNHVHHSVECQRMADIGNRRFLSPLSICVSQELLPRPVHDLLLEKLSLPSRRHAARAGGTRHLSFVFAHERLAIRPEAETKAFDRRSSFGRLIARKYHPEHSIAPKAADVISARLLKRRDGLDT